MLTSSSKQAERIITVKPLFAFLYSKEGMNGSSLTELEATTRYYFMADGKRPSISISKIHFS